MDSDKIVTDKILNAVEHVIPSICDIFLAIREIDDIHTEIGNMAKILHQDDRVDSKLCSGLLLAIQNEDVKAYKTEYKRLEETFSKIELKNKRCSMLNELQPVAPQWAEDIRNRIGIHGQSSVPKSIENAWKWKQISGIVDEIIAQPFSELQAESIRLSERYRQNTAAYAEKSGWYHLLKRTETDLDMKQALQGWKQTIKRIGKGTGKQAPMYKAKARELMTRCQTSVPAWIMPINRALETLNPKKNRFDVVIIDEASQSDISSLAILYMGKKLIIVGDDKQVSPMAVGVDLDKMSALQQMYLEDKIPNSHLYNPKTSIYDIAATTFQPLMLREHFRCVPEIIGFSNMLSYDYKIKPLRDASSSNLLPAVVNYRVESGERLGKSKTNAKEAATIVALMQACIEQPEYENKSFGVISLLGDEQVKIVQGLIERNIDPKEIVGRRIICGNSANFQGDERDVIFLSLVDSGTGIGPIRMMNFGPDDAYRKRYNVATSRAKDQLWVVDSLDAANDLKPGDIRKMLIDYSLNPKANEINHQKIEAASESPFETAVATALIGRGYHLIQQWKVGSYRIDMVAVCGEKKVAIECDGERWHSGEVKIREDMERQTILERLGWRFIRIRGSEYYRDSDAAINRIIGALDNHQIFPENGDDSISDDRHTELLSRVKKRAGIILYSAQGDDSDEELEISSAIAEMALTPRMDLPNEQAVTEEKIMLTDQDDEEKTMSVPRRVADGLHGKEPNTSELGKTLQKFEKKPKLAKSLEPEQKVGNIIDFLKAQNIPYVDKRQKNGALWVIGGRELAPIMKKAASMGVSFNFKVGGGRLTKGKDAWWGK